MRSPLSSIGERVANARIAAFHAALEPGHPLCRATVCERLRRHEPLRSLLQAVVTYGRRRVQPLLDVAWIQLDAPRREPPRLGCLVSPDAGITISLQFDAHRPFVGVARKRRA